MNDLILNELQIIKWLLVAVVTLISISILCALVFFKFMASVRKAQVNEFEKNTFVAEAHRLFDSGKFDELESISWNRSNEHPHDPAAVWFLALAHYKRAKWGLALSTFKKLQKLDPAWEKYTVEDYINEIQANMTGPKGEITSNK